MRALVTGGAGFIGSAVVRRLLVDPETHVLALDKLTYAANRASLAGLEDDPRFALRVVDICDADALAAAFDAFQPDAVLHLAAESHVDRSITDPGAFIETNLVGTHRLLEAARRYFDASPDERCGRFRLLHVSTDEVFGALGPDGAFDEATPYDPSSPYSASKAGSDHLVRAWGRTYGLPVLVSNCSNNYGPRQHPEKLIPLMILKALHGRPMPVYGDGAQVRDWLHVEDHAEALLAILEKGAPGETYAVGARCERRNIDLVRAICAEFDALRPAGAPHESLIEFVEDRPGHDARYAIDPTRLETELGWRPKHDLETGLKAAVAWYLDNEDWWRGCHYDGERLGLPERAGGAGRA